MALTSKQTDALNKLEDSVPGLKAQGEKQDLLLGNLLGPMGVAVIGVQAATLAAAATTVVTIEGAASGDIVAVVIEDDGTDNIAYVAGAVTADDTVTLTPSATPTVADADVIVMVFRTVSSSV